MSTTFFALSEGVLMPIFVSGGRWLGVPEAQADQQEDQLDKRLRAPDSDNRHMEFGESVRQPDRVMKPDGELPTIGRCLSPSLSTPKLFTTPS